MNNHTYTNVRAVYHEGVLTLIDPLTLPDGAEVQVDIHVDTHEQRKFVRYPTVFIPAAELDRLIGIAEAGGDALADSEALYDADWD